MCGQKTAIRRRKQAAGGYKNMAPLDRPHYTMVSVAKSMRKLMAKVEKERRIQQKQKPK